MHREREREREKERERCWSMYLGHTSPLLHMTGLFWSKCSSPICTMHTYSLEPTHSLLCIPTVTVCISCIQFNCFNSRPLGALYSEFVFILAALCSLQMRSDEFALPQSVLHWSMCGRV